MITTTFREQFVALTEAETLTVLGWLLEPGTSDPNIEMSDDFIDALQPITRAYQSAYETVHGIVTGECYRDRKADEADYRYDLWRDEQIDRELRA